MAALMVISINNVHQGQTCTPRNALSAADSPMANSTRGTTQINDWVNRSHLGVSGVHR
jgi:hypothetical protein